MVTLILMLVVLIIFVMVYIVSFFNTKVAILVDLILFTILNLRINKKNAKIAPIKLAKLAKALLYKRRLFTNKVASRRLIKKFKLPKTR